MLKRKATADIAAPARKKQKPTYLPERHLIVDESQFVAPDFVVNCAFIGDCGIGKSSLLQELGEKIATSEQNSLFDRYGAEITSSNGEKINISYWDISSEDDHSRMRSLTYRMNHIFFLCFSTTDRHSFDNARLQWFPEVDLIVPEAPVYLIGTQLDLRDEILESGNAQMKKTIITKEEGEQLRSSIGAIQYLETSINSKDNLTVIVKQIANAMLREIEHQARIEAARAQKSWKRNCNVMLGKDPSCMSPKKLHKVDASKPKSRESVAILSPSRMAIPLKNISKLNFRKSVLPIPVHDIENSPVKQNDQNSNAVVISPSKADAQSPARSKPDPFLKHLRKRLLAMAGRGKKSQPIPLEVATTPKRVISRWAVRSQAYCADVLSPKADEGKKIDLAKPDPPRQIAAPQFSLGDSDESDDEYDETSDDEQ